MKICPLLIMTLLTVGNIQISYAMDNESYQGIDGKGNQCEVHINSDRDFTHVIVKSTKGDLNIFCDIHYTGKVHPSCGSSESQKGSQVTWRSTGRNDIGFPQANQLDLKYSSNVKDKLSSVSCKGTFALTFATACIQLNLAPNWKQTCSKLTRTK